jgi:hypothetical protein
MFKKIIKLMLFIVLMLTTKNIICSFNSMSNDPDEIMRQMQNMTEDEYLSMLSETFKQYKNAPQEERASLAKEFGVPLEQMDQLAEEIEKEITVTKKQVANKKSNEIDYSSPSSTNIPKEEPVTKTYKDKLSYTIELLWDAEKILSTFSTKISSNQIFFNTIISKDEKILFNIEISRYYIGVIREQLLRIKNETNIIDNSDLEKINKSMQSIIDKLKILTENLQTLDSEKKISSNNNLYSKYGIKSSYDKTTLKKKINELIKETKNSISIIKKDDTVSEKTKKKLLNEKEFALLDLEKDLEQVNSARFEKDSKKQSENYKKQIEGLNKNIGKIASILKKIFEEKENPIFIFEEFITKYFPKDYEIGKKQEEITKRRLEEEIRISKQRGTNAPLETEQLQRQNHYGNDNYGNDNYHGGNDYGNYGNDYGNNNSSEPADFDKNSEDKKGNNIIPGGGKNTGEEKSIKENNNQGNSNNNDSINRNENLSNNKNNQNNEPIEKQNAQFDDIKKTMDSIDDLNNTKLEEFNKTSFDETKDEIVNTIKSFKLEHFQIASSASNEEDKKSKENLKISQDENHKAHTIPFATIQWDIDKDEEIKTKLCMECIKYNYEKMKSSEEKPLMADLHFKILTALSENLNKLKDDKAIAQNTATTNSQDNLNPTTTDVEKKEDSKKQDQKISDDDLINTKIGAFKEILKVFDGKDLEIAGKDEKGKQKSTKFHQEMLILKTDKKDDNVNQ